MNDTDDSFPRDPKILIIDDQPIVCKTTSRALSKNGFNHVTAMYSPNEAIEYCIKNPPDIIILDIQMPHLDGYEVLDILRERRINCRVMMSSQHNSIADVVESMKRGACAYLPKPQNTDEIIAQINKTISFGYSILSNIDKINSPDRLLNKLAQAERQIQFQRRVDKGRESKLKETSETVDKLKAQLEQAENVEKDLHKAQSKLQQYERLRTKLIRERDSIENRKHSFTISITIYSISLIFLGCLYFSDWIAVAFGFLITFITVALLYRGSSKAHFKGKVKAIGGEIEIESGKEN